MEKEQALSPSELTGSTTRPLFGLLCAAGFLFVLAVLLCAWAKAASGCVRAPVLASIPFGVAGALAGAAMMIAGWIALWVHGEALPLNPFPPRRHVTRGIFRFLPHPIYTGFTMACFGVAMAAGSSSGFWLVSPVVALSCAALVLGHERQDLQARFGTGVAAFHNLLPPGDASRPTPLERMRCYLGVLFPWLFLYKAFFALGTPRGAVCVYLPFEHRLPVWEWTNLIYASAYLMVPLGPLIAASRRDLRRYSVQGLLATAIGFFSFFAVPLVAPPRPFTPHGLLGALLAWDRTLDSPAEALPSFHVIWAVLTAGLFAGRMPRYKLLWHGWAVIVAISCVTTGMHGIVDILASFFLLFVLRHSSAIWDDLRIRVEHIANSWRAWRLGPARVIHHGVFAGLAGFIAIFSVPALSGPDQTATILLFAVAGVVGAALWPQFIEGSPAKLRPFGFYGALAGVVVVALAAHFFGAKVWLLLGAFSVCAPWVQAVGRLRCLVLGCCHGRPAPPVLGIRYVHPQSRVARLTDWAGVPLHPTPLYSILWNVLAGVILYRLWTLHAGVQLIAGVYLILNGLGRFVEEAYRGEPGAPTLGGLRLHQWAAAGTVVLGAALTTVGRGGDAPAPQFHLSLLIPAVAFGLFCWFAYGVDFPESNRRFARLA